MQLLGRWLVPVRIFQVGVGARHLKRVWTKKGAHQKPLSVIGGGAQVPRWVVEQRLAVVVQHSTIGRRFIPRAGGCWVEWRVLESRREAWRLAGRIGKFLPL